ncbi:MULTISPECIES: hypothetical protein [unclassified Paraburkholderia]|uniref:hypothetical protein n=1 Tax=unclassified Paraburkholderia TaxID=2615204 RepID=UPI000E24AC7B|nr:MULTISPECIES: hypothetical protein [unclassified Paraburkholderia]REE21443.1 hypothetical protein B0G71_4610 [Paraburkholderia sp. BL27I4N3]RKR38579.1 hypothetical protein B0G82_6725 [Paraburkholderia sp. BL17N1]
MSNNASCAGATAPAAQLQRNCNAASELEILALAREAGMLITLDGQIGREKYQSVVGSLHAFKRFAEALSNNFAQRAAA